MPTFCLASPMWYLPNDAMPLMLGRFSGHESPTISPQSRVTSFESSDSAAGKSHHCATTSSGRSIDFDVSACDRMIAATPQGDFTCRTPQT